MGMYLVPGEILTLSICIHLFTFRRRHTSTCKLWHYSHILPTIPLKSVSSLVVKRIARLEFWDEVREMSLDIVEQCTSYFQQRPNCLMHFIRLGFPGLKMYPVIQVEISLKGVSQDSPVFV